MWKFELIDVQLVNTSLNYQIKHHILTLWMAKISTTLKRSSGKGKVHPRTGHKGPEGE